MAVIASSQARAIFTQSLLGVYKERISPLSFFRSFFPDKISATKFVSIEVQRGTEKIAVDIVPGTEGIRNEFGLSSEKIFEPPAYREYFDATNLDLYDRMMGSTEIEASMVMQFIESVADHMGMLTDKIDRRYEFQASQVFDTGIVTLDNGTNIDFKRKAASNVDKGAGNYWATAGVDVFADLVTGCNFLRQVGKASGNVFNMVGGESALNDFFNNSVFLAQSDNRRLDRMQIHEPRRAATGQSLLGAVTAGNYIVNIFGYTDFFDDSAGVSTAYMNDKKIYLLPQDPGFFTGFGAVPQLIDTNNPTIQRGKFVFGDFPDQRKATHDYDVQSRGITIPMKIDQIFSLKVVEG